MSLSTTTRVIANGSTSTETINVAQFTSGSFSIPSAFTGATVQVQYSNNGLNWTNVESAISVAADNTYSLPGEAFDAQFVRLVSASSEAAERTITLGLRR